MPLSRLSIQRHFLSNIDHFTPYDFLSSVADIVHPAYPFKLIPVFQFLGHAFGSFHVLYDEVKPFLCLFIQIGKIFPQFPGQDKVAVLCRMLILEIVPMQPPITSDGPVSLRQLQVGDIVTLVTRTTFARKNISGTIALS